MVAVPLSSVPYIVAKSDGHKNRSPAIAKFLGEAEEEDKRNTRVVSYQ